MQLILAAVAAAGALSLSLPSARRRVLDFYAVNHKPLFPDLDKLQFTLQMSDHLPLWVQIRTDIEGFILNELIQAKRK